MKGIMIRKLAAIGFAIAVVGMPTAALADGEDNLVYFNDGNGTCGYAECGQYGCAVVWTEPCPKEISPNG